MNATATKKATTSKSKGTTKSTTPHKKGGLTEKAMLAHLSISKWDGRKKDNQVIEDVVHQAKAEKDSGNWWTRVLPKSAFSKLNSVSSQARTTHHKLTLPWMDDGARILPADMFLEYTEQMRKLRGRWEAAVEEFIAEYPDRVKEAKDRLGTLFNSEFYPPEAVIRGKFSWDLHIFPLPDARDFRVDLGQETTSQIRKSIEQEVEANIHRAVSDVWRRLHKVVDHLAERLRDDDAVLRESVVTNIRETCDVLPKLNVTGDKGLEQMAQEVRKVLGTIDLEGVRKDKVARKDKAKQAKDILSKMEEVMGAKSK